MQPAPLGHSSRRSEKIERPDDAASPVVRVFERDQPGRGEVVILGTNRRFQRGGCDQSRLGSGGIVEEPDAAPGDGRIAARLVIVDVALPMQEDLVSGGGLAQNREQIGHRSRGSEERRLFAEELRRALFQSIHGRILAHHVVAHFGAAHRLSHRRGGAGDGVGTEVDRARHVNLSSEHCSDIPTLAAQSPLSIDRGSSSLAIAGSDRATSRVARPVRSRENGRSSGTTGRRTQGDRRMQCRSFAPSWRSIPSAGRNG